MFVDFIVSFYFILYHSSEPSTLILPFWKTISAQRKGCKWAQGLESTSIGLYGKALISIHQKHWLGQGDGALLEVKAAYEPCSPSVPWSERQGRKREKD